MHLTNFYLKIEFPEIINEAGNSPKSFVSEEMSNYFDEQFFGTEEVENRWQNKDKT